ncbi:MAG: TetR family transcriptional regulator [Alphaproteobacteria bacterium HGW-Alphaproteobacteria-13]|nr:MAG: TetR family transcriptional regulator [Alphaproteobacteria bacterium HGW-Alphaproteobacteria-13]
MSLPKITFPDLEFEPREGGYARGQDGFELILRTALTVFIEYGYKNLTLRRIAQECGMRPGNISYYFKSKDELVRALFEAVAGSYEAAMELAMAQAGDNPERKLVNLIDFILDDVGTKKTTRIFPELWALANHDPFVKERVEELYAREHHHFDRVVAQLNPTLPGKERKVLTAFVIASLEGMTVFAGYGKPWQKNIPQLQAIASRSFVGFVKAMKPGDSLSLPEETDRLFV